TSCPEEITGKTMKMNRPKLSLVPNRFEEDTEIELCKTLLVYFNILKPRERLRFPQLSSVVRCKEQWEVT
ncbi:MAG: hypothetical protein QME81_15410, partial [bacterium]|nr:hypothetical protein [bacterium]